MRPLTNRGYVTFTHRSAKTPLDEVALREVAPGGLNRRVCSVVSEFVSKAGCFPVDELLGGGSTQRFSVITLKSDSSVFRHQKHDPLILHLRIFILTATELPPCINPILFLS